MSTANQKSLFRIERFASEIPEPAVVLALPWPPSVNRYWRHVIIKGSARVLISKAGRKYRGDVEAMWWAANKPRVRGRLSLEILATMPDRRTRDLDNLPKAVLDALQHAGLFDDDNQIDRLVVARAGVAKPGAVEVRIAEMDA